MDQFEYEYIVSIYWLKYKIVEEITKDKVIVFFHEYSII